MTDPTANWTVLHNDHGITDRQMDYIARTVMTILSDDEGFFIKQISIPCELGLVPCGLYGPDFGDKPIADNDVSYTARGNRVWKDRMIDLPPRAIDYVQVIGSVADGNYVAFTVYGGPLAPQHPDDPSNQDVERSKKFWAEHALSSHPPTMEFSVECLRA